MATSVNLVGFCYVELKIVKDEYHVYLWDKTETFFVTIYQGKSFDEAIYVASNWSEYPAEEWKERFRETQEES